jgi:hypothetical protein
MTSLQQRHVLAASQPSADPDFAGRSMCPGAESNGVSADSAYPGQFVLGPKHLESFAGNRAVVAGSLRLAVDSSLALTRVAEAGRELVLIGHILDPLKPAATNEDILHGLLGSFTDRDGLFESTNGYGGRWVMIASDGKDRFLFNDALGLRQVFYTEPNECGTVWAMSQPGVVARALNLPLDPEAAAFMESKAFQSHPEYRWPGAASPFRAIKHLLPNHWLNLNTGASRRYWPARPLPRVAPDDAVARLAVLLPGMVQAVAQRFDLALSLTAGLDSRLVMAAARPIIDRVAFVTVHQNNMSHDHPDLTIPDRILSRLGLAHEAIRAEPAMTPEFRRRYDAAVYLAHEHYGPDAEVLARRFLRRTAALTGSGAEVGRCSFRKDLPFSGYRTIKPRHLARLQRMERETFALRHFAAWLTDATPRHNVKLLDLFEWEQGHGNWLAMTQLEFDIAWREIITPYNCRAVFTTLLGVDERYRRAPDYRLFRRLIGQLWPELLQEPINPKRRRTPFGTLRAVIRSLPSYWS